MLKILYGLLGIVVLVSASEAPEHPAPPAPLATQEKDSDHQHQDDGAVEDKHESCPEWAASGECTANPGYMKSTCSLSCAPYLGTMAELEEAGSSSGTCSPESIQDGTCSMPDATSSQATPDQPEKSVPEAPAAHPEAVEKMTAAASKGERIPDVPADESQHIAGADADSPVGASPHAEGATSLDSTGRHQDPDTNADGPAEMGQQPEVETPGSRVDPGQPATDAHHDDGPLDHHDGPTDMTQQHSGDSPDSATLNELPGDMPPDRQEMPDAADAVPDGMPPLSSPGTPPAAEVPEHQFDSDMEMPPPGRQEMPDDPSTRGEPDMHMEEDLHPPGRPDLHQEDDPDAEREENMNQMFHEYEDSVPNAAAKYAMPEMQEMPKETRGLHNEASRREEEVRLESVTTGAPTLQAKAAPIPPAPGLVYEAVTSQAPLFDKEAVVALHKVVLSLSSGCWDLSKEASEMMSAALGGFLHLPAPLSSIATAFLFFLVALAFFRSLPTSSSAPSHEKSQAVRAAPVNSSPALSSDALNALVKQVEALRQEVGSLSSKLHSVSAENANAMMQLRQEMHSMHSERNQTDEELLLSVKEVLECLHGEVDGTDLNHCHPNHESSTSQMPALTHGVASMSSMAPAPATNSSMSSDSAVPAVSAVAAASSAPMQSSVASMPVQASAAASPVPAPLPQAQASMPPAPVAAPLAPAPVPVPQTAAPPSMPVPATTQAVPNTPPSPGLQPAVAQSAPVPPTSPLEAAGDFGKRQQQQQPISASGDPFGSRPQPKQFQASANPFGARPQPKDIPAAKGPFGVG